jgi:hypothetical protein
MAAEILVELDERRRASLARLDPAHRRYLAHAEPDGTIILRPVDLVPAVVGVKPATLEPVGTVDAVAEMAAAFNRHRERVIEPPFREPPQAHEGGDW